MVGGAPVTPEFAAEIGADAYAPDAASAVDVAKQAVARLTRSRAGGPTRHGVEGSTGMMTSRQRLQATLEHRQPDRVCVDLGATFVSGAHASTVSKLRQALVDDPAYRIRVIHPLQLNGEIDDPAPGTSDRRRRCLPEHDRIRLQERGLETVGAVRRHRRRGPGAFTPTVDGNGDLLLHPGGDPNAPASARMPRGGTTSTRSCGRSRSTRIISIPPTTPRNTAGWRYRPGRFCTQRTASGHGDGVRRLRHDPGCLGLRRCDGRPRRGAATAEGHP